MRAPKAAGLQPGEQTKAARATPRRSGATAAPAKIPGKQHPRSSAPRKRILLVDDHPLMREGTAQCIRSTDDLEVCGEAGTAAQALQAVDKLKPDLVLTDLTMPGRSGLELIKDLQGSHPKLPVMVFSIHDEGVYAGRALRAGARGYLMKGAGGDRLLESIRHVLQGRIAVSAEVSTRLLEDYAGRPAAKPASETPQLTSREFEIFQLIGEARTNREIAAQLHLSHKTVETHRLAIQRKLKLKSVAELVRYAIASLREEDAGSLGEA